MNRLAGSTSKEAAAAQLVVAPLGATEQHGPHLPLETDTLLATAVAEAIVDRVPGTVLGPVLSLGCSAHHLAFAGTISLRTRTLVDTLVDVGRSLATSGLTVLFLNGHGGNRAPLDVALTELAETGIRAYGLTYWQLLGDVVEQALGDDAAGACGHACALETSLMQHLHPATVREHLIPEGGTPPAWPDPHMFSTDAVRVVRPFDELRPDGVIGRPSLASSALGRQLFEAAVERGAREVRRITEATV
jgi:creatinine amidohydrolase